MVAEKSPPPLSPSASRLPCAGSGISPLHSSSPAKKGDAGAGIPPLQSSPPAKKEGGILGDQPPAGKVHGTRDDIDCRRKKMDKKVHGFVFHPAEPSDARGEAQVTLEQQKSGDIRGEQPTAGEVRAVAASSRAEKAQSGKVNGDTRGGSVVRPKKRDKRDSSEACVEQQVTVEARVEQQVTRGVPCSLPSSKKRQILENSGSLRPKKVAKVTNDKVVRNQLQNKSKTVQRLLSPIVSGSPMINMMARKRAQSQASSPNPHAKSPKTRRTMNSPSLHDLSPAAPTIGTPASIHDLSPAASNGSKRKPRKLTSIVWKHAEPIYIDGVLMQGRCKYCNIVFPASKVSGTSQLGRHLRSCEVKNSMDVVIEQIKTSDEIDPHWKFDQETARNELVKLIVLHGLPFSFVEYAGFRKFCASLNPWFKSVNRVTIQNDCMDAYYKSRDMHENFFKNCNYRVSLTGDMWTSNQKLGYLCITCHWIDSKWQVRHRIIRFCLVETPHDAWNMFDVVLNSLRTWNIENKLFSFTMDNAEVNTKMLSHLKKNLVDRDLLHHEGNLLHVRCAAHVLNLIVQDGLKTMKSVVDNVRESVKYIRSSQGRKEQFAKMVAQAGIKCKRQPSLDVSTRWNSTFLMLESALPFRKVFKTLEDQEPNYAFGPSNAEWTMVEDICQLLKVFCHATNVISGSNYPTSNLYFLEIWSVKCVLDEQEESGNVTIRMMVTEMKKKFHKYFMESYLTNCIPVVLDPRFKLEHVVFRLKQYFGVDDSKQHILEVKKAIRALFIEYGTEFEDNVDIFSEEGNSEEVVLADSSLLDWHEHIKAKKATSHNELQRYLEEDFHPHTPDFSILKWWAVNTARYPTLGRIARDVLAVPASSVASESAFSTCGRIITDHRSSLATDTVEALMCYGDWIRLDGTSSEASTPHAVS